MSQIDVSLVLACYNEGPTLQNSLDTIVEVLDSTKYTWEILCIDDCSKDDTQSILRNYVQDKQNISFSAHTVNVGRGGTVMEGLRKSQGRVVGFIDVDLEVSPVYIPEFVRQVDKGADIVIATRVYKEQLFSIMRWLASKVYLKTVQLLFGLAFKDTEAGYKFFNRASILPVLDKVVDKRWFFDTEIILRGLSAGLMIKEVPVLFLRRDDKQSTVRLFRDSIDYLVALWGYKKSA